MQEKSLCGGSTDIAAERPAQAGRRKVGVYEQDRLCVITAFDRSIR